MSNQQSESHSSVPFPLNRLFHFAFCPRFWLIVGLFIAFLAVPMHLASSLTSRSAAGVEDLPLPLSTIGKPLLVRLGASTIYRGGKVTGEILIDSPETFDVPVRLTSSSPDIVPPEKVTIPKERKYQTFTIDSAPPSKAPSVDVSRPVILTAYADGFRADMASIRLAGKDSPQKWWERPETWSSLADTFALLSVVWLTALCLFKLVVQPEPSDHNAVPLGLRLACLLAIIMALPSSISNAMLFGTSFWIFISLTLIFIAVYMVIGHRSMTLLGAYRKKLSTNSLYLVVTLISASGALGGFSFHLISNQYRIELPAITYLGIYPATRPIPEPNRIIISDAESSARSGYPQHDKSLLLATNHSEAFNLTSRSREPRYLSMLTALFAGVLGDIIIGVVAANAAHLLVSGLMWHRHSSAPGQSDGQEEYQTRQRLTIISLGVVAGFAGPRLLPAMADDMLNKTRKELAGQLSIATNQVQKTAEANKAVVEEVQEKMDNLEKDLGQEDKNVAIGAAKLMESHVIPFLKLIERPVTTEVLLEEFIKSTRDKKWRDSPEVVAVQTFIFLHQPTLYIDPQTTPDIALLTTALQKSLTPDLRGQINLLSGRLLLNEKKTNEAKKFFETAAAIPANESPTQWIRQAASLYLTLLEGPGADPGRLAFDGEPTDDLKPLFDHMRMTSSMCLNPDEPNNKVAIIYKASALYEPKRWSAQIRLTASAGRDQQDEWKGRQARLEQPLSEAKLAVDAAPRGVPGSDSLVKKLEDMAGKDWDLEKMKLKISIILPILKSELSGSP